MRLVLSTDTKLDKLFSSITSLAIVFVFDIVILIIFPRDILGFSFMGNHILGNLKFL